MLSEVLAQLGSGDEVSVSERLKEAAAELASVIAGLPAEDRGLTEDRFAELLEQTSAGGEAFLTIAFPVVEYACGTALEALPRALRHVAGATAAARTEHGARSVVTVPPVGRLVWALAAFSLHCDRPRALVAMTRAQIRVRFNGDVIPVIALRELRYPDALHGSAGESFRDYREWLLGLSLLEHHPLFRAEFDSAFDEGDLLLAMYLGRFRRRVYSGGRHGESVSRLVARVGDDVQREAIAMLFPGEGELGDRLEQAYAATEGDPNRFESGPARLFGDDE